METKELKFSDNWNKKLNCKWFTTIRQSGRLEVGDKVDIIFGEQHQKFCVIMDKKHLRIKNLTLAICALDTGYDREETIKIIGKMFGCEKIDPEAFVYWYLLGPYKETQQELNL